MRGCWWIVLLCLVIDLLVLLGSIELLMWLNLSMLWLLALPIAMLLPVVAVVWLADWI